MRRAYGVVAAAVTLLAVSAVWMVVHLRSTTRVEVCGYGSVTLPVPPFEAAEPLDEHVMQSLSRPVLRQLVAALDQSTDDYERAIGHYLARFDPAGAASRRDALVELALRSSDGRAYWLALTACLRPSLRLAPCDRMSNEQWARLDPDNAMPWFALAGEAHKRGDAAALGDALLRASRARTFDADVAGPHRLMQRADMRALPEAQRLAGLVTLIGIWAALPLPRIDAPLPYCRDQDTSRRPLCSDLATLLVERSHSFHGFSIGAGVAKDVWDEERRGRLADERDALGWAVNQKPESWRAVRHGLYVVARLRALQRRCRRQRRTRRAARARCS